ncbi:unnamed protein product [Kluyveromyces dobzhanskii CBS 2104]|uniref:WGS project CCBQ000000000 data, contig 00008 n=1 Tax=Kluyveromyces dobzhanskii CBS 2104 TaxID=1427455 RepID=A0A0A8L7K8_9SACH|nr:unnamed protein product [Kluyveromyces dobzhanskii CBS 2104]
MGFATKRFQKLFKIVVAVVAAVVILNAVHIYLKSEVSMNAYKTTLKEYTQKFIDEYEYRGSLSEGSGQSVSDKDTKATGKTSGDATGNTVDEVSSASAKMKLIKGFYSQVFQYLKDFGPEGVNTPSYSKNCNLNGDIGYRKENVDQWWKLTGKELGSCLQLSHKQLMMLKHGHSNYVEALGKLVLPKDTYKGDGIVTVGGGKFSMMAFLLVKSLRNSGTGLPVEVFIPPADEGDDEFCNALLPKYNAKCIFLSDVFPDGLIKNTEFKGYQFKSLAIIASSFKNLLLLDADNYPIRNLDGIFDETPYKDNGLVLWPDFWRRTTHPAYYHITDSPISTKRVRNNMDDATPATVYTKDLKDFSSIPLHDFEGTIPDASTESGQLMINKATHFQTVLLSLYYNVYGPSWYYSIFSQRSSGEGDKETFIAAAHYHDLPFYQVRSEPRVDGYHRPNDKGFRGVCMLQHDFAQDYKRHRLAQKEIGQKYSTESADFDPDYTYQANYLSKYFSEEPVDVMFVHSHLPKFDPVELALSQDLIEDGKHIRSYRNLKRMNGYDLELESFKVFKEVVCDNRVHFKYFDKAVKAEADWTVICKYINERLSYLNDSHANALDGKF